VACCMDRYTATYVVAPSLGPPDCRVADFTDIQVAINALPPAGGKVFIKAGTYVLSQTILIQQSNVHLQGEGMGITNIVAAQTMTASPAIRVYNQQAGNALPLLADTSKGDASVTLTLGNAASLTSGNHVLLFSNKPVDTEDPHKHAGEVKQVEGVDVATGQITFDDQIYDGYLVSDGAATARITMLQNVTLSDFSVTTLAPVYTGNEASISCRLIDNLQIERVESHHTYVAGIQLLPCATRRSQIAMPMTSATNNRRRTSITASWSALLRKMSASRAAGFRIPATRSRPEGLVEPWRTACSVISSLRIARRWSPTRRTLIRTIPQKT